MCFLLLLLTQPVSQVASMPKTSMLMEIVSVKSAAVLKDRRDLSEDGVVLAVATIDFKSKVILSGPDILSRGFIHMRESGDLIRQESAHPLQCNSYRIKNKDASIQSVNGAIVNAIRPFLYENTEREPIIIPDDPHTRWRRITTKQPCLSCFSMLSF